MEAERESKRSLMTLRIVVISCLMLGMSERTFSQFDAVVNTVKPQVVHDPVANANAVTTLGGIANMVTGINAQIDMLQDAAAHLSDVSGIFQTLRMVDEIMLTKEAFYLESQRCMTLVNQCESWFGLNYFSASLTGIYGTTRRLESELRVIDAVLTNNLLTMSTAERLSVLRDIKQELMIGLADVRIMRRDVERRIAVYYYNKMYLENYGNNW